MCVACAGSIDLNDLSRLVDAAASLTSADDVTLQDILETLDVPTRWGSGPTSGALLLPYWHCHGMAGVWALGIPLCCVVWPELNRPSPRPQWYHPAGPMHIRDARQGWCGF